MFGTVVLLTACAALLAMIVGAVITVRQNPYIRRGTPCLRLSDGLLDQAYRLDSSTLNWHIRDAHELGLHRQAHAMHAALGAVMLGERIEREMQAQLSERQPVRPVVRLHISTLGVSA